MVLAKWFWGKSSWAALVHLRMNAAKDFFAGQPVTELTAVRLVLWKHRVPKGLNVGSGMALRQMAGPAWLWN